jgi:hypothetical protein
MCLFSPFPFPKPPLPFPSPSPSVFALDWAGEVEAVALEAGGCAKPGRAGPAKRFVPPNCRGRSLAMMVSMLLAWMLFGRRKVGDCDVTGEAHGLFV